MKSVRIDTGITVQFGPEWVFTFDWNQCSVSTGMGVQIGPEYAAIFDRAHLLKQIGEKMVNGLI